MKKRVMRKIVLIGAGQMGKAVEELIDANKNRIIAYGDNDKSKWTCEDTGSGRIPIMSIERVIAQKPDLVIICVMGDSRISALWQQIEAAGYRGEKCLLKDIYDLFDIRGRCLHRIIERIRTAKIPGEMAELGVYRGDMAWQMNHLMPEKKLYLFDTFEGFDSRDLDSGKEAGILQVTDNEFSDTSVDVVMSRMPHPEQVVVEKGYFPETAKTYENLRFSLVSLDADLYLPTLEGMRFFYDRTSEGGTIILHDYDNVRFSGVKRAVEDFEKERGNLRIVPIGDLHGSCVVVK